MERLRQRKVLAVGAMSFLGLSALAGCGSNDNKATWEVGILCPSEGKVNIEKVDPVQYSSADIDISCAGVDGKKASPQSMEIIRGPGIVTDDGRHNQTIYIDARYYDGSLESQHPSLSVSTSPETSSGNILVRDIKEITGVRTQLPAQPVQK